MVDLRSIPLRLAPVRSALLKLASLRSAPLRSQPGQEFFESRLAKSSGSAVEWIEEESYFFKLSKWQEPLLKFYSENPNFILPSTRKNEVVSFVKSGLKDLSISRTTFNWGIKVPNNENHVIYVWLDALINYLSAIGYPDKTVSYTHLTLPTILLV